MRAYRLHDTSWQRIITARVRRPQTLALRLGSRRRRDIEIPVDGRLVLVAANHTTDPRTGGPVDRRELLDRLIEALSVDTVDGVVASADLLEELTLLNTLERRLAVCATGAGCGTYPDVVVGNGFDAGWVRGCNRDRVRLAEIRDEVAGLHRSGVPALVDIVLDDGDSTHEYETDWRDWLEPLSVASSMMATGQGVWFTLPAVTGIGRLTAQSGFPILLRDTDVPLDPAAWAELFAEPLPLTVRGMILGASALFPMSVSVAEATATLATAVR